MYDVFYFHRILSLSTTITGAAAARVPVLTVVLHKSRRVFRVSSLPFLGFSCVILKQLNLYISRSMLDDWTVEEATEIVEIGSGVLVCLVVFCLGLIGE